MMATGVVFDFLEDARVDAVSESTQGVTTSGNYTANVTLGRAAYGNTASSVNEITSNNTLDTPTTYQYNSTSRVLTVNGLAESGLTRTLSVSYNIASAGLPTGAGNFITLLEWFYIMMILGTAGGAIYSFFVT